jgi:large subunit ribosomal protein L28
MAHVCEMCGSKPLTGNKVSHANNRTRRRWLVNLKRVRVSVKGAIQTMRLCTRCIRTGKAVKVV